MEKSTKLCITTIIVALIWFSAQPIGGNMSIEANFDKVPYFNLTNSTISGHAEISGYMPIGIMIPAIFIEIITSISEKDLEISVELLVLIFTTFIVFSTMYIGYKELKNRYRKDKNE